MTINNSPIIIKPHEYYSKDLGELYFFENYFAAEFKEGIDIDYNNFTEIQQLIYHHFGNQPFGFVANRIHSYSINLSDAEKFNKAFPNLKAYAIISYNPLTEKIFEIENRFFKFRRKSFKDLKNGAKWTDDNIKTLKYPN